MKRVHESQKVATAPAGACVELHLPGQWSTGDPKEAFLPVSNLGTAAATAAVAADLAEQVAGGTTTAVTATVDGLTTGLIPATAQHVEVTSDTATKQISLPAATNGKKLTIRVIATGCELISAVATDKVNNVVVGATNEAALVAGTLYTLQYVEAVDNWVMTGLTALGAVETPVVPDIL